MSELDRSLRCSRDGSRVPYAPYCTNCGENFDLHGDNWRDAIEYGDALPTEINGINADVKPIPDFTPASGAPICSAKSPGGFVCTLRPHLGGLHVAGDGHQVVGIWYP